MQKIYKTGISYFLLLLLGIPFFIFAYAIVTNEMSSKEFLLTAGSYSLLFIGMYALISSFRYQITEDDLVIKGLLMKTIKIKLETIKKVEYSKNYISSPAGSLKRLEVYYNKYDSIVISPKDRKAFIDEIVSRNSGIVIVNNL